MVLRCAKITMIHRVIPLLAPLARPRNFKVATATGYYRPRTHHLTGSESTASIPPIIQIH